MKRSVKTYSSLLIAFILFSIHLGCGNNGQKEAGEEGSSIDTLIQNDPHEGNNMRNEQPTQELTKKDSVDTDTL